MIREEQDRREFRVVVGETKTTSLCGFRENRVCAPATWSDYEMPENKRRAYYSARSGKNLAAVKPDLAVVLRLFRDCWTFFSDNFYFQEAFGYVCVDAGPVAGTLGSDIEAQILRRLRKGDLWPVDIKCSDYSEDDLFDMIEFLYDYVSKPLKGRYHDFSGCGWHYSTFDLDAGRSEFRVEINDIIKDYSLGYELSEDGEILALADAGLTELVDTQLPSCDPENIDRRVHAAIRKFRRYHSSEDDRRDAVRDLADVLEFMRPKLASVLTKKDESDLFEIANRFGIRHHNDKQHTDYDQEIWHTWMFYYYLATIHAATSLLSEYDSSDPEEGDEVPF